MCHTQEFNDYTGVYIPPDIAADQYINSSSKMVYGVLFQSMKLHYAAIRNPALYQECTPESLETPQDVRLPLNIIAFATGLSLTTTARCLKSLCKHGLIRLNGKDFGTANTYTVFERIGTP